MSTIQTYTFSRSGCGSLDLELDKPSKQVYNSSLPESIPFKISGLDYESKLQIDSLHFFEWQKIQYSYIINEKENFTGPVSLIINNRVINTSKNKNNIHLLTGQFSFDDQIGETRIEIKDANKKLIFSLETEVFPQKMDYKSDYKAMMAEISAIIQNLAYDTLKDTFRKSKTRLSGHTTQHEWWNILDALFNQLILNLGVIRRQPKHEIRVREKVMPVEKIKQTSNKTINWFIKNSHYSCANEAGINVAFNTSYSHALSGKKYVTYDTYENRFVKWAVKDCIEQLRKYKTFTENSQGNYDYTPLLEKMKEYQGRLQGILHESPFNEVGDFEKRAHFSTSLTRGTGYKDFMQIYLLLTKGLELADNNIFKIEQKNISTLYEYWCFLKLVQLLKEQNNLNIDYQDLIRISTGKFKVELEKGTQSKVKFIKPETQETTTIYFNKSFTKDEKRIFTYNQKPDYSIEFKKDGFDKSFWYLFDAKYRFDEYYTEGVTNSYNVPQDAIGQLHRYRDAILHTEPVISTYRGAIKNLGGIILYPYPLSENEFKKNDFYKSISGVNIGAMPFLPSKTGLVNGLLNSLINKMPEEHFEQFIDMDRSEYEKQRNKWKEWVTISVVPADNQKERLNFIADKLIYHIPFVNNTNSKLYQTKKLFICNSGTNNAAIYDVKYWEVLTDTELIKMGCSWNLRSNKYIAFHLENGNKITTIDRIAPIKYRYATLEGMNRYLRDPVADKYCFYLTNYDAARLYQELKNRNIGFQIKWNENEQDLSHVEFQINNLKIYSSDRYPELHFMYNSQIVSFGFIQNLLRICN